MSILMVHRREMDRIIKARDLMRDLLHLLEGHRGMVRDSALTAVRQLLLEDRREVQMTILTMLLREPPRDSALITVRQLQQEDLREVRDSALTAVRQLQQEDLRGMARDSALITVRQLQQEDLRGMAKDSVLITVRQLLQEDLREVRNITIFLREMDRISVSMILREVREVLPETFHVTENQHLFQMLFLQLLILLQEMDRDQMLMVVVSILQNLEVIKPDFRKELSGSFLFFAIFS